MGERRIYDDCWELIFKHLQDDYHDLASVSLACKRFLLITNQSKASLSVTDLTAPILSKLLQRFQNLKCIVVDTESHQDLDGLVSKISEAGLGHLEALELFNINLPREGLGKLGMKMKNLKRLKFLGISNMCDDDLIMLADLFPCLEELDIYGQRKPNQLSVTDNGIDALASKLRGLERIALHNVENITDKSLVALSSKCVDLKDICIHTCPRVTGNGIGYMMRHSSKLTSLSLEELRLSSFSWGEYYFTFRNSISYARNLECIRFYGMIISDEVLCSIAKARAPLKHIYFNLNSYAPFNFSAYGLTTLLRTCSSLKQFTPSAWWLSDNFMLENSKHFSGLTFINLNYCKALGSATFFMLTKNCPLLESISMDHTRVGTCEDVNVYLHRNYRVDHVSLSYNMHMNDEALVRIALVCPNLENFGISYSADAITNEGIAELLEVCPHVKQLDVTGLGLSNFVGLNKDSKLKLNSIFAGETSIDDEALEVIGKRCPNLEEITIDGCNEVTSHGVKMLLRNCEKLRKIDMSKCENVSIDILDWIVSLRPSLRQIIPPRGFDPTKEQKKMFLQNNNCELLSGYYVEPDFESSSDE